MPDLPVWRPTLGAKRFSTAATVLMALLGGVSPVSAQAPPPTRVWLAAGAGPGGASDGAGGLAGTLNLSALRGPHQLSLRLAAATPVFYSGASADEVSVLYSRALRGSAGHLSAGGGLGVTSRDPCNGDGPACDAERAIAVAIGAEAALRVFPVAGLGAQLFVNLSRLGYMGGVAVFVQIGWLPR
ncbi:MAG TPA: hypothetical protein VK929_04220 [Longimicrobiales bacterium]|nr:hypothetical protein [Longimicrobiales bacterium]